MDKFKLINMKITVKAPISMTDEESARRQRELYIRIKKAVKLVAIEFDNDQEDWFVDDEDLNWKSEIFIDDEPYTADMHEADQAERRMFGGG